MILATDGGVKNGQIESEQLFAVVGIVAFDKLAAAELADVRDVFGRRHAGYLVKFMVEMRMVGVAQSCGDFRNVGSFRGVLKFFRGKQEASHTQDLFGRSADIVGKNAAKLSLA